MEERVRRLRVRLKTLSRGKVPRGLRYPAEVRDEIVQLAREAGGPSAMAQALGVPVGTIMRWGHRVDRRLRRITIASEPPAVAAPAPTLVLISPEGWRVEGLDVATLLHVLQHQT